MGRRNVKGPHPSDRGPVGHGTRFNVVAHDGQHSIPGTVCTTCTGGPTRRAPVLNPLPPPWQWGWVGVACDLAFLSHTWDADRPSRSGGAPAPGRPIPN